MYFDEIDYDETDFDETDFDETNFDEQDFDEQDFSLSDRYEPDFDEIVEDEPNYADIDNECFRAYDIYLKTFYEKRPANCTPVCFTEFYNWEWKDNVIRKHYKKLIEKENNELNGVKK